MSKYNLMTEDELEMRIMELEERKKIKSNKKALIEKIRAMEDEEKKESTGGKLMSGLANIGRGIADVKLFEDADKVKEPKNKSII